MYYIKYKYRQYTSSLLSNSNLLKIFINVLEILDVMDVYSSMSAIENKKRSIYNSFIFTVKLNPIHYCR